MTRITQISDHEYKVETVVDTRHSFWDRYLTAMDSKRIKKLIKNIKDDNRQSK